MSVWAAGCAQERTPPSVLLITIDTLRADHLGCYGYERAQTPNLDALAEDSVVFDRAHTVSNNTLPAHASMLTGRYPHAIGIPRNSFTLAPGEKTLATELSAVGYETAAFVSASALASPLGLNRGFDLYDETFGVREMDQEQRRAESTTDAVLAWLRRHDGETPFFLWVHYFDPHYPYTPPEPFDRLYGNDYRGPADGSMEYLCTIWGLGTPAVKPSPADVQRMIDLYDGEIAYLDVQLGRLFRYLDEAGLRETVMTVVTADHGESLDEHDYYFNHGLYLYEPSLHVPLIVEMPDDAVTPRRIETQVETFDIFPTVMTAAGLPVAENVHGIDLTPLLTGDVDGAQRTPPAPGMPADADPRLRRYSYAESCRPWGSRGGESAGLPQSDEGARAHRRSVEADRDAVSGHHRALPPGTRPRGDGQFGRAAVTAGRADVGRAEKVEGREPSRGPAGSRESRAPSISGVHELAARAPRGYAGLAARWPGRTAARPHGQRGRTR